MIILNILLNCEHTRSSEAKQIHFKSLPTTPLEIKNKIEEDFSIPSCIQTLHYQSMILKDSDQLQLTHIRSGDTFTVDYLIEAECEMTQTVIRWLDELYDLLKSIEESISFPDEQNDLLMSSNSRKIENLILEGEKDSIIGALSVNLFSPQEDKMKLMNQFYFYDKGGPDVLMKVYGILVNKKWGDLGADKRLQIYLEQMCSIAICNYGNSFQLRRQIIQLGGVDMCIATLLRRELQEGSVLDAHIRKTLRSALFALCR